MCVFFFSFLVTINQDLEQFKRKKTVYFLFQSSFRAIFKKISLTDFFFKLPQNLTGTGSKHQYNLKKKNFSRKFKHKRILILFISLKNMGFKELVSCII